MTVSGAFCLRRVRIPCAAAMGLALSLALAAQGFGQSPPTLVELAYDNGPPASGLDLADASVFAMRFTPPSVPARLLQVKYFLSDTTYGTSFNLFVHDDNDGEPANVIYGPLHVEGGHLGWNSVDLRQDSIVVERDFHVAIALDGQSIVQVGAENTPPITGRANLGDCCGWWRWSEADLMIRAVVELLPTGVSDEGHPPVPRVSLIAYPNPSHGEVRIRLQRADWQPVALTVVDLAGRTVAHWHLPSASAGLELRWNPLDERGRPLPSGIYLLRAADGKGNVSVSKLLLVR